MLGSGLVNYEFGGDSESSVFTALWNNLSNPKVKKILNTAVRRFAYSCVRHKNEDKIIDLMIAAESLFLRGKRSGQKSKTLATRASCFLANEPTVRIKISTDFREAYKLRSKVVHEGSLDPEMRHEEQIEELIGRIGNYLQAALFKAVDLLTETDCELNDSYWNSLHS